MIEVHETLSTRWKVFMVAMAMLGLLNALLLYDISGPLFWGYWALGGALVLPLLFNPKYASRFIADYVVVDAFAAGVLFGLLRAIDTSDPASVMLFTVGMAAAFFVVYRLSYGFKRLRSAEEEKRLPRFSLWVVIILLISGGITLAEQISAPWLVFFMALASVALLQARMFLFSRNVPRLILALHVISAALLLLAGGLIWWAAAPSSPV